MLQLDGGEAETRRWVMMVGRPTVEMIIDIFISNILPVACTGMPTLLIPSTVLHASILVHPVDTLVEVARILVA